MSDPTIDPATPSERSREVRLGLVLYGGVSLAVYINGVAQEFFRAVRGAGVFRLLKALTDSDIVVDVVSGTSAGGINGILLSYCLCNRLDFHQCTRFWRDTASMEELLRDVRDEPANTQSILDSENYFQPQLERALELLRSFPATEDGCSPSRFDELDLFVPVTRVDGDAFTVFDDSGHEVNVKDHRAVFLLKHREGRRAPFHPEPASRETGPTIKALARLCRMTASYPVAFAPVFVKGRPESTSAASTPSARTLPSNTPAAGEQPASTPAAPLPPDDALLAQWGLLNRDGYYLDGGILDNKPLAHVIGAVFSRTASRPVERRIFFVEPTPERCGDKPPAAAPNFFRVISDSLSGIPSYESIAGDLLMLQEHNAAVKRINDLLGATANGAAPHLSALPDAAQQKIYDRACRVKLCARALDGVLGTGHRRELIAKDSLERARSFVRKFQDLAGDDKLDGAWRRADVYFHLRRMFDQMYFLHSSPDVDKCGNLLRRVSREIEKLEVARYWMEHLMDSSGLRWIDHAAAPEDLWDKLFAAIMLLIACESAPGSVAGCNSPAALHASLKSRESQVLHALASGTVPDAPPAATILETMARDVETWLEEGANADGGAYAAAWKRYRAFPDIDAHVFPVQMVAGIEERDEIKLTRISPVDAQQGFSLGSIESKLAGDSLAAFAGFFKRSWRANDILWGRLDGVCELIECLLTKDRIQELLTHRKLSRLLKDCDGDLLPCCRPDELFPNAPQSLRERIRLSLLHLCDIEGAATDLNNVEGVTRELQSQLISAAHWEILHEHLEDVVAAGISDQMDWNQFQTAHAGQEPGGAQPPPVRFDARGGAFVPSETAPGPLVITAAVREMARQSVHRLLDPNNPNRHAELERFFRHEYRAGEETFQRDIPLTVTAHLAARAALVLRNCIATGLPPRFRGLRDQLWFKCLTCALTIAYAYTSWWRRTPVQARAYSLGGSLAASIVILCTLLWTSPLLIDSGGLRFWWLVLLLAAIVFLVGNLVYVLDASRAALNPRPWPLRWAIRLGLVAGITLPLVLFTVYLGWYPSLVETVTYSPRWSWLRDAPYIPGRIRSPEFVSAAVLIAPYASMLAAASAWKWLRRRLWRKPDAK